MAEKMDAELSPRRVLERFADLIQQCAGEIPPPNPWTPQFYMFAMAMRNEAIRFAKAADSVFYSRRFPDDEAGPDVIAWLIEVDGPRYLSLDPSVPGFWTVDHMKATRFGRRVDAENYLSSQDTIDPNAPRIVEHMWMGGEANSRAQDTGSKPGVDNTQAPQDRAPAVPMSKALVSVLDDVAEYLNNRADADHNGTTFIPNEEMRLLNDVNAARSRLTAKGLAP